MTSNVDALEGGHGLGNAAKDDDAEVVRSKEDLSPTMKKSFSGG